MQRLSEVCSAAASENIQLIGNFLTKVRSLSLPPPASFLANGTADLDGANLVVFALPNQEEVEFDLWAVFIFSLYVNTHIQVQLYDLV